MLKRWPSLSGVLVAWGAATFALVVAHVLYMRRGPGDELEMASNLSFQLVVAAFSVGVPSLAFLFLFLLIGAIAKRWLMGSNLSIERTAAGKPASTAHVER